MAVIAVVSPSAGVEDVVLCAALDGIDARRAVREFDRAVEQQRESQRRRTVPPPTASPRGGRA
jgi:hypothetical protein